MLPLDVFWPGIVMMGCIWFVISLVGLWMPTWKEKILASFIGVAFGFGAYVFVVFRIFPDDFLRYVPEFFIRCCM